ncbi:ATP synthase F1 subunit gamma [Patescibacteria group bacterium]|nr:ATP synthase F1 subunit gamma [Patescibacteria group bacterium]MBU1885299.1 ATP synthase F1 subunit gamma [Patescibacteria group bacterium]
MSSTKIIKRRIKSATNISQITKAMEMVAASKMRFAQESALASRPYTEKMRQILTGIIEIVKDDIDHFLLKSPEIIPATEGKTQEKYLVIILSSDKGLCGGLNSNLYRGLEMWQNNFTEKKHDTNNIKMDFITVGKKAKEHVLKTRRFLLAEFPNFGDKPRYSDIVPLYNTIFESFKTTQYQKILIVFMEFISTISQRLTVRQLLPIQRDEIDSAFSEIMMEEYESKYKPVEFDFQKDYIFEPSAKSIFDKLLPKYLGLYLYHIILESTASEHSARMVAMKSAHDNATEIVKDLSLEYNQLRQQKITSELLDAASARMVM